VRPFVDDEISLQTGQAVNRKRPAEKPGAICTTTATTEIFIRRRLRVVAAIRVAKSSGPLRDAPDGRVSLFGDEIGHLEFDPLTARRRTARTVKVYVRQTPL